MRLAFLLYFLTLVVLSAHAAPESSLKPAPIKARENPSSQVQPAELETIQASPFQAPSGLQRRFESFGSTNFGLGFASGIFSKSKETKTLGTFHLQRTQFNLDETAQEFGLSISTESFFTIDWAFKKYCCFSSIAGPWKPYYKYGAAGVYSQNDGLGNVIDYQRYFAQVAVGFESLFGYRERFRLELGARYGALGGHGYFQLLYALPD